MSKPIAKNTFYDKYHRQNEKFINSIGPNNFTYYLHIKMLNRFFVSSSDKRARVLDIGCGVGSLAFYLAKKEFEVTGIDVSSRAIEIAKHYQSISGIRNIHFIKGDVEKIKFDRKFDFVLCTEVIEHLENDLRMLMTIRKLLVKDGIVLLSTPSVNAPLYKLGLLEKFDKDVGHLRRYDEQRLRALIEDSGFELVHLYKNESVLRNSLFTFRLPGKIIRFIRGPLVPFFHVVDDFLTRAFGESDYIVILKN